MLQKCDCEYGRFQIEQPLIEVITKMITNYQIQDVSFIAGYKKLAPYLHALHSSGDLPQMLANKIRQSCGDLQMWRRI